jgi:hypothetical protein|tara:strand:+ start:332 stop:769 length:438 start_codon:yes stop_codon:yes gene_type:complete
MNFKNSIINRLHFREHTNLNSNSTRSSNNGSLVNPGIVEGFSLGSSKKIEKEDDIFVLIDRKLKGLTEELGGSKGTKEVKKILEKTKKISDLECAKCMMMMIENTKGVKALDLDALVDDDSSDMCLKCKNYTSLSTSIKSMIDNL